jgi:phage tail-like protein
MTADVFRLLDGRTGWDAQPEDGLIGIVIDDGSMRLAPTPSVGRESDMLPDLLAWSCEDCTWWLGGRFGLRRLGPCNESFVPGWVRRPVAAVAAGRGLVVVLLRTGRGTIQILDAATGYVHGEADVAGTVAVALVGDEVLASDRIGRITHLDLSGLICRTENLCLPVQVALPRPVVEGVTAGPDGFCLPARGCFDWDGRPTGIVEPDPRANLVTSGEYLSLPLDSGIPGCRWHRLRLDAEVPAGTTLRVAVATTDGSPVDHRPHPNDWIETDSGTTDVMLRTPPGRWAYLRVRMSGDGQHGPVLHQVRLDLPRRTGLDQLPAVYSEDPRARDFSERFIGLFDAWLDEIDDVLDRRADLFDAAALPDDALGWLAGLIGLGFEPEMSVNRRRMLLAAAPELYRRRGTPSGLLDTLRIAIGISGVVEELGSHRPWGAVGTARLGEVRLFGRSTARVRLGSSRLGRARMIADGDPDLDAVRAGAHRIRVHVPPLTDDGERLDVALVTRVVRSQTPAHLATAVAASRPGFVTGRVRLGVDTVLTAPQPAVLTRTGPRRVGLGRTGVVARGRRRGLSALVGQQVAASNRSTAHGTECAR